MKWGIVVGVAVLLVGLGWFVRGYRDDLQRADDRATIAQHEQTIKALQRQQRRVDSVYISDTVNLRSWRDRWDTLRLVTHTTDTLVSIDTLRLVVGVADSTIQACTTALGTCEERLAVRDQRIAVDSSTIRALSRSLARARVRSRLGCVAGPTLTPGGIDYVGVSCGIRVF